MKNTAFPVRFAHAALSVRSLDRTAAFYKEHLGFSLAELFDFPERKMRIGMLKRGRMALEVFELAGSRPGRRVSMREDLAFIGTRHIAFELPRVKPVYDRLVKAGVEMATGLETFTNGARYFYLKDPDGILVECIEPAPRRKR